MEHTNMWWQLEVTARIKFKVMQGESGTGTGILYFKIAWMLWFTKWLFQVSPRLFEQVHVWVASSDTGVIHSHKNSFDLYLNWPCKWILNIHTIKRSRHKINSTKKLGKLRKLGFHCEVWKCPSDCGTASVTVTLRKIIRTAFTSRQR